MTALLLATHQAGGTSWDNQKRKTFFFLNKYEEIELCGSFPCVPLSSGLIPLHILWLVCLASYYKLFSAFSSMLDEQRKS